MRLLLSTFAFLIITNLGFSYRFSGKSFYKRSLSEKLLLAKVSGKNNNEVRVRLLKDSTEGLGQKGLYSMLLHQTFETKNYQMPIVIKCFRGYRDDKFFFVDECLSA